MKRDGFLTEVVSGRKVNNRDRYLLRGQALFQPNDNFSIRVIGDYSKRNEECCAAPFLPAHNYRCRHRRDAVEHRRISSARSAGSSTTTHTPARSR